MILIADVHGAVTKLRALVAATDEQLVVLGDLINFVDYRTMDGILAELAGRDWVRRLIQLRTEGRIDEARALWSKVREGDANDLQQRTADLIEAAYEEICGALEGADAVVTFGNVDRLEVLQRYLPEGNTFIEAGLLEIEGWAVGVVGGGVPSGLRVPGELSDDEMARRLSALGPVEILCTHVPPAVPQLQRDVVGGTQKGSQAVLEYVLEHRPQFHYFGDIHQPQAINWVVGDTLCRNAGYFRATGRGVHHPAA